MRVRRVSRAWRDGSARAGRIRVGAVLLVAVMLAGCVDPFLGPAPDTDSPVDSFDALWTEFDRHYSFFELKDIDWDALREEYRPRVTPETGDQALLRIMGEMLDHLEDGHVNLYSPAGQYAYIDWFDPYPESFWWPLIEDRVASVQYSPDGKITWGRYRTVGYIHLGDFVGDERVGQVEDAVRDLQEYDALILDVRSNGGGSARSARLVAGLFADTRFHHLDIRYRNGPGHDDFTEPDAKYVVPREPHFNGPVVVLTNRRTFSAAEDLVLAMKRIPGVTVIGDTTGGGAGSPITRELPNGWTFRLSRWIATDPSGWTWEGVGIAPDLHVVQTADDLLSGREPVLDSALAVLEAALGG